MVSNEQSQRQSTAERGENAPELVIFIDEQRRIVTADDAVSALLGYTQEDLAGWPVERVLQINWVQLEQVRLLQQPGDQELSFVAAQAIDSRGQRLPTVVSIEESTHPAAHSGGKGWTRIRLHLYTDPAGADDMRRRYEFIVNTSRELMAMVRRNYTYEAVNTAYCQAQNRVREEIIGRSMAELWGEEVFQDIIRHHMDRCFDGQEVNYQAWYVHAALGMRYMDVTYYPYFNHAGVVTHTIIVSRDITEREHIEAQLRRYTNELEQLVSERTQEIERRRQAAEGLGDILRILNSNRSLYEILEHIYRQAVQLLHVGGMAVIMHEGDRISVDEPRKLIFARYGVGGTSEESGLTDAEVEAGRQGVQQAMAERRPVIIKHCQQQGLGDNTLRKDEPVRFCTELALPLELENSLLGILAFYYTPFVAPLPDDIDVANALANHVVLAYENSRLQRRAEEAAVMEERERLARELHDAVTQSLYSLTLFAEAGRRLALAGNMTRVQDYLGQLGETAQQALKEMRLLLYELRPMVLEQEGLVGALRRRLDAVERRAGVASSLEVIDPFHVPQALEEGLYRICQEALNNTLKHANATIVVVRLSVHDELVDVEVADNGVGFAPVEQSGGGGMGLANMRERAQRMGGKLVVTSQERRGTSLHVLVPVAK